MGTDMSIQREHVLLPLIQCLYLCKIFALSEDGPAVEALLFVNNSPIILQLNPTTDDIS